MKITAILAGFALASVAVADVQPNYTLSYQWSLSGKQYATVNTPIRKDVIFDGLTLNAVASYEVLTGSQPTLGSGRTYLAPEPEPWSVGYQWSFSGKQYATANTPLRSNVFGVQGLNFNGVFGYEVVTGAQPTAGLGFSYDLNWGPVFADIGAFALFPQKSRPDVGLGLQFGVKF